jgi:hypothetical protein
VGGTEFQAASAPKPRIPDRIYEAQCIGHDLQKAYRNTLKLFLRFKIIEPGEYEGTELFMPFNMPLDRKCHATSKYYKTWCLINGSVPSRNAKMSPKLFMNKIFKIETKISKPKLDKKRVMPEPFWYSVVCSIIERIA